VLELRSCQPMWLAMSDADLADACERASDWSVQRHSDGCFQRVLDFDAHQGIQAEISQRLVVAQTVWLDAQDGADDIAHPLRR